MKVVVLALLPFAAAHVRSLRGLGGQEAPQSSVQTEVAPILESERRRAQEAKASRPAVAGAGQRGRTVNLKIIRAYNLIDRDWGFGVSDPYVKARIGVGQVQKTPVIDNNLNPIWTTDNEFTFHIADDELHQVVMEVMDQEWWREDRSMGTLFWNLDDLPSGVPQLRRERLQDGGQGELEFEILLVAPPAQGSSCGQFDNTMYTPIDNIPGEERTVTARAAQCAERCPSRRSPPRSATARAPC